MEANELRIGNLLSYEESTEIVIGINNSPWMDGKKHDWIETENFEGELLTLFEPIPLTEDWLIRFGFKHVDSKLQPSYQMDLVWIWPTNGKLLDNNDREVKSVHQLQNLYFALTGTELTLKN